mgnify:CR=1 FL=1
MASHDVEKLRAELETLRSELETSVDRHSPSRPRIEAVLRDLENHLSGDMPDSGQADIVGSVRNAIRHFETEHPRATAILNDIMVVLSNMGI